MAFNAANLVYSNWWVHGPDGRDRMWDYNAGSDTIATVESGFAGGYFASAAKTFRKEDPILVTASDGNALYVVDSVNPASGSESVGLKKLAAGVTSFPT